MLFGIPLRSFDILSNADFYCSEYNNNQKKEERILKEQFISRYCPKAISRYQNFFNKRNEKAESAYII